MRCPLRCLPRFDAMTDLGRVGGDHATCPVPQFQHGRINGQAAERTRLPKHRLRRTHPSGMVDIRDAVRKTRMPVPHQAL